ncbi:ParB/RepB/Spo0J family partition protein [Phormidium tenue]|jgi:ParB family chromosome partitioning protein|uniref:ParB/RepB/Spo0J family partition protein n=1 Tax=Phormidium tenue FACHB-1050 TaxID=2692857 RepID=A0ABR8CFV9_9CYAN|nr:ParB/RepB/Spo0J family partition protein [Phormidium tenue]MBD2319481.1 ParB/RepB/Spo0J family partition protein [Phormidium tenue FACHB-1050]
MGKIPSISQRFTGAIQATDQAQRISELQAEVEKLRSSQSPVLEQQIETLRSQLQEQSGEKDIEVSKIQANPHQPRQTITNESILIIARSLEKDGQITPLIVIPQDDNYLLLDGQRRWEAAKILGWQTLRSVIAIMPNDLHRKALLTFIHHEDLNPLDKAEAIFKEVADVTSMGTEEILTVLATVLKRLERQKQTSQLTSLVTATTEEQISGLQSLGVNEAEEKLLLVLLGLALNPTSVKANLMPMLSLPNDLKQAIRERGLKGAHALALSVLSAKTLETSEKIASKERIKATEQVLSQDLNVAKTRELIAQIKAKYIKSEHSPSKEITAIQRSVEKLSKENIANIDPQQLTDLRTLFQQKLAEIESILEITNG